MPPKGENTLRKKQEQVEVQKKQEETKNKSKGLPAA